MKTLLLSEQPIRQQHLQTLSVFSWKYQYLIGSLVIVYSLIEPNFVQIVIFFHSDCSIKQLGNSPTSGFIVLISSEREKFSC